MIKIILLISTFSLLAPPFVMSSETNLISIVEQYEKAANTGDTDAFKQILALDDPHFSEFEDFLPDLIGKQGVSDILNWGKENPNCSFKVQYKKKRACLLADTVGYVTSIAHQESSEGKNTVRATFIIKKYGEQWKIVHGHWSEAPKQKDKI